MLEMYFPPQLLCLITVKLSVWQSAISSQANNTQEMESISALVTELEKSVFEELDKISENYPRTAQSYWHCLPFAISLPS